MKVQILIFLSVFLTACVKPVNDAEQVLDQSLEAAGGKNAWAQAEVFEMQGALSYAGLEGEFSSTESVTDGRYASSFKLGPYQGAEGFDGQQAWFMDPSGDAVAQDSQADVEAAENQAWFAARAYWFPERHAANIAYKGVQEWQGRKYDVIEALPRGGRTMQLWFSVNAHQLERVLEHDGQAIQETVFADFRKTEGLLLPYKIIATDTGTGEVTAQQVHAVHINVPLNDAVFAMPVSETNDTVWPEGKASVEIPFRLANNHIYIDVSVNGVGPLRFLVDTGGLNLLTRDAAARIGIKSEGSIKAQGTGEKTIDVGVAKADALRLGDVELHDQTFFVADLSELQKVEGEGFDGLVGFEVFRRFVVRIEYENERLVLFQPETFAYHGDGTRMNIRLNERTPEVDGSVDGITGVFSIDTGSRSALDLHAGFVEKHALDARYCPCVETITGWGVGGPVKSKLARADELVLGGQKIMDVGLELTAQKGGAYADEYLAGNIGGAVLKRFNVIFDYSRNEMILEPHAGTGIPDAEDKSGLWINRDGEMLRIAAVSPGSAAEEAGLREGDGILSVNGKPVNEIRLSELRESFRESAAGTVFTLVFVQDGEQKTIELVLREPVRQ